MKKNAVFFLKQVLKNTLQMAVLPCVYSFWRLVYARRPLRYIVFADAHHDTIPYSLERMYRELSRREEDVVCRVCDYAKMTPLRSFASAVGFMRLYAQARYVFICDNFLPVSSCRKRPDTRVVQLFHSCGLLKHIGYDTDEDIPKGYIGPVYRNYDLLTVSAESCVEPLRKAMGLAPGTVKALGVSRSDNYFDLKWREDCVRRFYETYPQLRGKKLILWAPTFRGNAALAYQVGVEEIDRLEQALGEDYCVLRKLHPHVDIRYHLSNCHIPTEELFPVVDLLISDYSSVICEFMFFQKPYVLFAPDLDTFQKGRGLYVPYESLSPYLCTREAELMGTVRKALADTCPDWVEEKRRFHLGACDGHSTRRILEHLNLYQEVNTHAETLSG